MKKNLPAGYEDKLIWWPELEMGYHPADPIDYNGDYWKKYLEYDKSPMGLDLTKARKTFVSSYTNGSDMVDIGIGGGLFVREMNCYGYDVNHHANQWLMSVHKFKDPYDDPVNAITCWDAIEHIPDPVTLLNNVKEWVFASIPVFGSAETVTTSKHYKPGEHIWYWSHNGFIKFMERNGFMFVDYNVEESKLGREDIVSYAFKRYK
jgi:hypothetical protein